MRAVAAAAASLMLAGLTASSPLAAQFGRPPAPGLTVWIDADYKGRSHTFLEDTPDISATGLGRAISSVRPGPGELWQVCGDPNYGGRCRVISNGVSDLRSLQLNDAIMSVRKAPASMLPAAAGLELYAGVNFTGRRIVLREETPDFRRIDFSDRAISLRVPKGQPWEICINVEFDECRQISEDVPDLAAIGFTRIISSARPYVPGRGRGPGFQGRGQLVLYDGANYSGRSVTISDDQPSLNFFSSYTGSIRVQGGDWQLCDRQRFYGNCVAITESVRDLSRLNLRGPVVSIRRQQERD